MTTPAQVDGASPWCPECPRCGYDQSGEVATWTSQCPMAGRCPECGLDLLWSELYRAVVLEEHLKFEFAGRRHARALVYTWQRSLRPWRFWSWMRLVEPVKPRRLAWYGVLGSLTSYAAVSFVMLVAWMLGPFLALWITGAPSIELTRHPGHAAAFDVWAFGMPVVNDRWSDRWQWRAVLLLWVLLLPLAYRLIGTTLAQTNVRPGHVWRVNVYTLAAVPAVLGIFFSLLSFALSGAWLWASTLAGPVSKWRMSYRYDEHVYDIAAATISHRWSIGVLWLGAWLIVSQGFALKRYLKIPHPWIVAFMLTLVTFLAAFTCMAMLSSKTWLVDTWRML